MNNISEEKRFSIVARAKSLTHAFRGLKVIFKTQHNAWVHVFFGIVTVVLGCVLNVSVAEWALLVFAMGFVFVSEAFNTALEIDIDLTSPEFHPYARDTKDVAVGAVLLSVITAVIIGLIIFLPKILTLFK